ncbi:MAG: hypothetical protein DLM65_15510 [Candidatus Aeolococcus gillhamiae]|uniref:Uncharacterized protein n=1 Tax=Candidatus Aeolococcus gillhamiae TaxID=3127015 RepID=A0A2W5YXC5_9BACT|nr:MAG: hypothetical protein DLM65_15510 [Candidatus Dormibacter sp. RRmetagenome_bin12]
MAGLAVVLLFTNRGDTGTPIWTGACTNSAGVTHTWTADSGSPGFVGPGSASASAAAPARSKTDDQATYRPPDPNAPALGAIADGVDPVDAARFFGTVFLPGNITAAQRAAAQDPATYGWHCSH